LPTRAVRLAEFHELRNTIVVKTTEDRTRDRIARSILENGPQSAADLSARLHLTPAGIRRHLDLLVQSGILEAREPYLTAAKLRGRGRPTKVFVITDLGREKFEHSYDDLAVSALRFMASTSAGDLIDGSLVKAFAQNRAQEIERSVNAAMKPTRSQEKSDVDAKVDALAKALTIEGYAAESKRTSSGVQLCQHHCPIAHVASEFPQLCDAETEAFSRVLGTHVQRLATIAHGDGICTTFIPATSHNTSSFNNLSSKTSAPSTEGALT